MSDISFLSDDARREETRLKASKPPTVEPAEELQFVIPPPEEDQIEIIEIDEGELEDVLANEPFLARAVYKFNLWIDEVKIKLFTRPAPEPPPKLPPQFLKPEVARATKIPAPPEVSAVLAKPVPPPKPIAKPVSREATKAAVAEAIHGAASGSVRITPLPNAPHRVRVIKRVRKPVQVSFVDVDTMAFVDVGRRKFTIVLLSVMCMVLLVGGAGLLMVQRDAAEAALLDAKTQQTDVRNQIAAEQKQWSTFQDLEPKLRALLTVLDTKRRPTVLLRRLEDVTLPTVSYGSLSLTPDGRVQLSVTADSLATAAAQLQVYQGAPFIARAEASGYTFVYKDEKALTPQSVQFQLNLQVQEPKTGL